MTTASPDQLALFDLDALAHLGGQLRERRYIAPGADRLLAHLIHRGLAPDALAPAAALILLMDEPRDRQEHV